MAYLGNVPAEAYSSIDKQVITGDGGASYTLDHSVANENEIEVFVNNVRQEPSVAYTVSGTALTMTGNVESSDDFYVVFQGKAVQTTSHPEGQDLKARDGTFSGDVTIEKDSASIVTGLVVKNSDDTADNGIRIDLDGVDTSSNNVTFARIQATYKNHATEKADLDIYRRNDSGNLTSAVHFNKDGYAKFEGGITFNGDTAAANTLDDYEEGTWTPTTPSGSFTVTSATYTKIGNLVICTYDVQAASTVGADNFGGLPFTPSGNCGGVVGYQNLRGGAMTILIESNGDWNWRQGSTQYGLGSGDRSRGTLIYHTNA